MDDNSDTRNFKSYIWNKITELKSWNEQHRLLPTTDSPTISASTTATNLSFLENQKFNQRMSTYEENLRTIQPEVIPLKNNEKPEFQPGTNNSINNCSSSNITIYNSTTIQGPKIFTQVITSLSVSLVSMVVGFVSAYTSPAMESLQKDLHVSNNEISWVGGLMPLGALCGGLVGGQSIEFIGRKWTILATDLLFVFSWIFIALASNIWLVYCGRAIAGFAVGIGSLAFPVYLGETIQPEVRGTLGLLPTALGNIGILLSFVIGMYIPWKNLAWVGVALPVPFLLMVFFVPESPRWYISKGKVDQAQNTLQWLRGKHTDIHEELGSLAKSQKEADQSPSLGVSILMKKSNLKPLFISLGLMFFQQLSGINAVIFYTSSIFDMAGSTIDKGLCTIIVGIVNFISTFIATVLIDRLGRKVLLYISSVTMTITSGILGTYFYLSAIETNVTEYGWLPLVSFIIYVLGFSLGFGPIPWLMLGEIFPARIRGLAASVATSFNWMCTFIVTKTFVNITDSIGPHGAFWMFAIICAMALVFVVICVPETQGQSLQDIERKLAGLKVRRMSSVANLKPLPSTF